jgi:hypothetical protein
MASHYRSPVYLSTTHWQNLPETELSLFLKVSLVSHTPEWGWVAWATGHPSANKAYQHSIPERGGEEARTRNSKLEADGVIMVTS